MELDDKELRRTPDAGALYTLPNGIQVQRRVKHELPAADIADMSENRTGKEEGSKFNQGTSLKRIVEMTVEILLENHAQIGSNGKYHKVYEDFVGISRGKKVKAVRVLTSNKGKYAHGFPVDERNL